MKNKYLICLIFITIVGINNIGCWPFPSSEPELCCNSEGLGDYGEVVHAYCNDYTVAVSRFLRKPNDIAQRETRRDMMTRFLNGLRSCQTIDCIVTAVDTSSLVPAFDEFFDEEHEFAKQRAIGDEVEKVKLLFCGFEHGLNVYLE